MLDGSYLFKKVDVSIVLGSIQCNMMDAANPFRQIWGCNGGIKRGHLTAPASLGHS